MTQAAASPVAVVAVGEKGRRMTLAMVGLLAAAGIGGGFYLGRKSSAEKPGDAWLIAAFAAGLLVGTFLTKSK